MDNPQNPATTRPSISVILPTFNERDNIAELIERVAAVLSGQPHEIIVVDDDSPDGTSQVVEEMLDRLSKLRLITRKHERGLVTAIQCGLGEASSDIVAWLDADLSQAPEYLPDLLGKIAEGYDVAVASRYVPGGAMKGQDPTRGEMSIFAILRNLRGSVDSPISVIMSWFGNWLLSKLLVRSFRDYTSGFIALRRNVLDRVPVEGYYGDYFIGLIYLAFREGFRVVEVPYVNLPRKHGESKTGTSLSGLVVRAVQYLKATRRFKRRY